MDITEGSVQTGTPEVGSDTTNQAWWSGIEDVELKSYAEKRNWASPFETVKSYHELEKKLGNGISIPNEDDTEGWNNVFSKLGRPDKPEDYGLSLPEGEDPTLLNEATKWMHEAGLNKKQAQQFFEKYNGFVEQHAAKQNENLEEQWKQEVANQNSQWGLKAAENEEYIKRAIAIAGYDDNDIDKMIRQDGLPKLRERLARIGSHLPQDHKYVNGIPGSASPQDIDSAKQALFDNPDFMKRFNAQDPSAFEEIANIHKRLANG